MWDAIYAFIIAELWITSFFWSSFHVFALVSTAYGLFHVFTWSHREGSRKWSRFRSMALWDWLFRRSSSYIRHSWHQGGGWASFEKHGQAYLFIVHPQAYGLTSFIAFGLHGRHNKTVARLSPYVMMPSPPFYYPLVSDIIQWAGGIVHTTEQMQDALSHNFSIVWSPAGGMMRSADIADPLVLSEDHLSLGVFDWISSYGNQCRFNIVPVCHVGEACAYHNASDRLPSFLRNLQQQTYAWCGVEFPLPVFGLFGSPIPRSCELKTLVGEPISTMREVLDDKGAIAGYAKKTAHHLRDEFRAAYAALAAHSATITSLSVQ
jgi:hypothetical protein